MKKEHNKYERKNRRNKEEKTEEIRTKEEKK